MAAFVDVCVGCPMPPVYMPGTAATGITFGIGLLLLCVGQMAHSVKDHWDTGTFYMAHAWACGVSVLVLRHTVLRAAACLVCLGHQEVLHREAVEVGRGFVAMGGGSDSNGERFRDSSVQQGDKKAN